MIIEKLKRPVSCWQLKTWAPRRNFVCSSLTLLSRFELPKRHKRRR
jgi:hypothetical protein